MGYSPHLSTAALISIPLLLLARIFYRAFLHPLASIPGPRIAAFTSLYRAYYDIVRDGEWSEQLHDLHARYGKSPIHSLHYTWSLPASDPLADDLFSPQAP
jgi:hypothetical protein